MYFCEDCGEFFIDPEGDEYEGFYCPFCQSEEFTEAAQCEHCAKYCYETREGMCTGCYEDYYFE